jgi:hypothetical protein
MVLWDDGVIWLSARGVTLRRQWPVIIFWCPFGGTQPARILPAL